MEISENSQSSIKEDFKSSMPTTNSSLSSRASQYQSQLFNSANNNNYHRYICGFAAAIVNIGVTFPINKIIFRQMLHGHSVRSATADLRAEGIRYLYRGVGPPLIQRSITTSLMFGTFGTYQYLLDEHGYFFVNSRAGRFCLAAFMAGTTEALLCPFERIQMLLQVCMLLDADFLDF